ncbi:hypothetical protein [Ottowia sp.]|uniref:hypothetical protein n=1 Tax=Ottowia sp. TaxID=1898956 RepID=UPI0025E038BD|nr:hypothetical protein [Ottowia sp.]MBK6616111.1 hypothetical protein [Ottowia sp.]
MAMKRICLIGGELGDDTNPARVDRPVALAAVVAWAKTNSFDGLGLLSASHGVVALTEDTVDSDDGLLMSRMGRNQRALWAASVCDAVMQRWNSGNSVDEFVLLCGLSGYQELVDELRRRSPASAITVPLTGIGVVKRRVIASKG